MSTVIRDGKVEPSPGFTLLTDETPLPAEGQVIVTLSRWQQEQLQTVSVPLVIGVRLPNTVDIEQIWPAIAGCPLINLDFPSFGDGRAYSQARLLRDRLQYRGDIRASGAAVVADQIHGMLRCGISSFALREDQDVETCLLAMNSFSAAYQPAADRLTPVTRLRLAAQNGHGNT